MKNEIIFLDRDYSIQIDTRNRRLNLYYNSITSLPRYFRKSDILKINMDTERINFYRFGLLRDYHFVEFQENGDYEIGCCRIPRKLMNSIQNRFKNMK